MLRLDLLEKHVKEFLDSDSSGHDFHHVHRVMHLAIKIQQQENQGDLYIIAVAALVHDLCRSWEKQTGKSHFGPEALVIIRDVLLKSDIQPEKIEPILDIVAKHDIYDWDIKQHKSIELKIVQDADNLDAIGAIGIGRTFAFGGANGLIMYEPNENLQFEKSFIEDPNYKTTTIAHFYDKLLKLAGHMNTETGKALALKRHKYMEVFLEQFFAEWFNRE
jgi:uncharacterized protein